MDQVNWATIDLFSDHRVCLGPRATPLEWGPEGTLLHRHKDWMPELLTSSHPSATVRAVISGDVVTFSIEVGFDDYDSFRLTGEYHSPDFPPLLSRSFQH